MYDGVSLIFDQSSTLLLGDFISFLGLVSVVIQQTLEKIIATIHAEIMLEGKTSRAGFSIK